jgi:N-acetylglutamate synthase
MPVVMEPSWVGRRVSVRRVVGRRPDGRPQYGDVVGDLLGLDANEAVIDTRTGLVAVAIDTVTIARVAPPSTADELALEAVAATGWRAAETAELGGWVLRADGGFTGRANSVLPLRAPGLALDDALARASAWYAERGLPLKLLVPTEARRLLDAGLGERGYLPDPEVHVMAARLDQVHAAGRPDAAVTIADEPDEGWFSRYRDGAGASPVGRALLTRHDNAGFASVRDGDHVVAIGRATIDDGWLGVTAVEVDPALRRSGLAATVMAALWEWGRERGAVRSYLQVSSVNAAAVALYTKLGYWVHHDYRYRTEPQPGPLG